MKVIKKVFKDRIVYHNEEGKIHRDDDLPAVEWNDGGREWCINGKHHREGGLPAIEYDNGTKIWYIKGECHREDGPSVEWSDGVKEWWLGNIKYNEDQYQHELVKIKLKRLIEL